MQFDITERVHELWHFYDEMLEERIKRISELSGVEREHFKKINPVDFIEKNKLQVVKGHHYINIREWIKANKTDDKTFLISPLDSIKETAEQVGYKSNTRIERTIRASKCEVVPFPTEAAQDFFIRNHRQSPPLVRSGAVCFALTFNGEVVAAMLYGISNGAVRGANEKFELVRLAIARNARVHGGASKLQKACEETLHELGVSEIYSYSNATINSGAVYRELGFTEKKIDGGQPFVIMRDNKLERLINLFPESTDKSLAMHGRIITHIGGNKTWVKDIEG